VEAVGTTTPLRVSSFASTTSIEAGAFCTFSVVLRAVTTISSSALAGAAAVSVVALGLASWRTHRAEAVAPAPSPAATAAADPLLDEAEAEFARAAAAYEKSIEKLRGLLEREEPRWSPVERARCAERLAQLDEAIATSRELAHRSPGDGVGNEQVFAAYQQKIAFLAEAVHRGGTFQGEPSEPAP